MIDIFFGNESGKVKICTAKDYEEAWNAVNLFLDQNKYKHNGFRMFGKNQSKVIDFGNQEKFFYFEED